MSQHEKMAWWALASGVLIWSFLLMRFTENWQIVELPAPVMLQTYVTMIVLWIVAAVVPSVIAARDPYGSPKDERDRAIEAQGDRWEGWVVVIAINVLIVHMLTNNLSVDRTPSLPRLELATTSGIVFALLTVLFLADAVKQAMVIWQYRR
jgi:hypothetical protein